MPKWFLLLLLLGCPGLAGAEGASSRTAPVEVEAAFALPEGLRDQLGPRLSDPRLSDKERVRQLLDFMVADDGLALRYREQPTLDVTRAYEARRVNCLSFSLMFVAIARAAGLRAHVQAGDDVLASEVLGDTLFRVTHVNVGVVIDGVHYTIDVGWRSMLAGQPPRPISDAQAVALLRNNEAVERLLADDIHGASKAIESALVLDSATATIWNNAGVIHARSGRRDLAEQAYLHALRRSRANLSALGNLVRLYRASGDAGKAGAYTSRLERAQERDPYFQFLRARELAVAGDHESAVLHYRRAIRLMPDVPAFHRGLAEAYLQQGRADAASRAQQRADSLEARAAARGGIPREDQEAG